MAHQSPPRTLRAAFNSGWPDLEDAIVYQSARLVGVDIIVTRNADDFRLSDLPLLSPAELLAVVRAEGS